MQKDTKEISSLITTDIIPIIFEKLNDIQMKYEDEIETWDYNAKEKLLTGKLKNSKLHFAIKLD